MSTLGFRIEAAPARPAPALLAAFRDVVTPHVSDNMNRLCGVVGLSRYHGRGRLVGSAFTVKTRPGDNLMIHKALDLAGPGDVIVVDGGGALENALVGEIMSAYARARGIAGFVIDGAIRDVASFAAGDFPCYARGVVHRGPYKDGPGEINVPVAIGGLVIHPGEIVLGDEDGVVAFPQAEAAALLERVRAHAAKEQQTMREIASGTLDRGWIDATLRAKGVLR